MTHLDDAVLAQLAAEGLDGDARTRAEQHVAQCASCAERLLGAGDAVTRREGPGPRVAAILPPGTQLGRYIITGTLGAGGMGVVYAANDPELARKLAIKLVRAGKGSDAQLRLLREAQAMARLQHPNVVAIHDVGTYAQKVFLAMELVAGESLREWLARAPRHWREVLAVFCGAGAGLVAAHAAGLVHRDFKLDNVMVDASGRPRVTDFGLARSLDDDAAPVEGSPSPERELPDRLGTSITRAGTVVGTPAYMAPEQRRGAAGDARSDQFSFCVSLYEALYHERPFGADTRRPRPPPAGSRVPAWIRRIIVRGLATDPADRWPSMAAVLDALVRESVHQRRWVVAALVGPLALVGAWLALGPSPRAECSDADALAATTWNPTRRAAVAAAFERTGVSYAPRVFETVAGQIDRDLVAWKTARTEACRATRVRGVQPEEVMLLRFACLERQRAQLAAVVDVLAKADPKTVELAVQGVATLPRPAECDDVRSLTAIAAPPADPALRAEIETLRLELASASALGPGKPADAIARLEPVRARAVEIGYRPLEAEALFALGVVRVFQGESQLAREALQAAALAAAASGSDRLEARACARLTALLAHRGQIDEARTWASRGRAILERIGSDPVTEALLDFGLASTERNAGNHEESIAILRRVIAARIELYGPDHPDTLVARANLGSALDEVARPDEAIAEDRAVIAGLERTLGPHHPRMILPSINLALVLIRIGKPGDAEPLVEHAATLATTLGPKSHYVGGTNLIAAELALEQGRFAAASERAGAAVANFREVVGEGSDSVGWALGVEGAALAALGELDAALDRLQKGVSVRTAINPELPALARDLTLLGEAQLAAKQPREALVSLERALTLSAGRPRFPGELARTRFAAARALIATRGDRDRARELATAARDELAGLDYRAALQREVTSFLAGL